MKKNLDKYLKETEYCDYNNYLIMQTAKYFEKRYKTKKELAVALFYWVKDSVRYSLGAWNVKASETFTLNNGTCTNKANLLVALYRAVDIPAGFGIMKVNGQRYLGPACIPMLGNQMNQRSIHTYVAVYLNNKWMKIDPSDDIELSESISHFNHTADAVEWNGIDNAELNLDENDVYSDEFPIADIDYIMRKKPRNAKGIKLKMFNIALNFYRKEGKNIKAGEALEPILKKYLLRRYPLYFIFFLSLINYIQLKSRTAYYVNSLTVGFNEKFTSYMFAELRINREL